MAIMAREKEEPRRPPNVNEVNALLGKGSEFEGKLTFEGTVRIDGIFSGQIFTEDVLIVGEGAVVKAEIEVGTIIIHGHVLGNIRARTAVEIHAPGRLKGNIITPALQVDRGVIFEGSCQMENVEEKLRQRSAALGAATTAPPPSKGPVEPPVKVAPSNQP
jgi:cytoskeletal protein CcmA (bactofilin family)